MENILYKKNDDLIISYITLRRAIGILGMAAPFILYLGTRLLSCETHVQCSISDYYYTCMGDVFVGILCSFAFFLFSYKGPKKIDGILASCASVFALGVAFFPTEEDTIQGKAHLLCAALFFVILTIFSLFLFTKTGGTRKQQTPEKKKRNTVFVFCGIVMFLCILGILSYFLWFEENHPCSADTHPVFWFESTALFFFGISWITKGELLLKDK